MLFWLEANKSPDEANLHKQLTKSPTTSAPIRSRHDPSPARAISACVTQLRIVRHNGERRPNSNFRLSDSPRIHSTTRSIQRTGTPEPLVKRPCLRWGIG